MNFNDIKNNKEINIYIESADQFLRDIGYTEHSFAHVTKCVQLAEYILEKLGYEQKTIELAKIAAYMHDIGNVVNRANHAQSGALMAFRILDKLGMPTEDIATIVLAIGNHDEGVANPVNPVASALILADKMDVRRSRVRPKGDHGDIHNRVNYAVISSNVEVKKEDKTITLNLVIDTNICPIMEYFEIFLTRMKLCSRAAQFFNLEFKLIINNLVLL